MFAPDGQAAPFPPPEKPASDPLPRLRVVHAEHPSVPAAHESQSPSLQRLPGLSAPAYEIKFLLDESLARTVEDRLRSVLTVDPHAASVGGNGYHITTLYCDTPERMVFERVGRYRRFKLRLRQYGSSEQIFLERKSKQGNEVRKRRSSLSVAHLSRFEAQFPEGEWEGDWYHRQLLRNRLAPVCRIEYQRVAYYGSSDEGPLRLTFDRQIHGGLTSAWSFATPAENLPLLVDHVVCEFKFRDVLPKAFKTVIQELQLTPGGCSKFRRCLQAAGLSESGSVPHA